MYIHATCIRIGKTRASHMLKIHFCDNQENEIINIRFFPCYSVFLPGLLDVRFQMKDCRKLAGAQIGATPSVFQR